MIHSPLSNTGKALATASFQGASAPSVPVKSVPLPAFSLGTHGTVTPKGKGKRPQLLSHLKDKVTDRRQRCAAKDFTGFTQEKEKHSSENRGWAGPGQTAMVFVSLPLLPSLTGGLLTG